MRRWLAGLRCGRVRKRRWRYLDNTLSPRERTWVARHLERCLGCRAEFARSAFALESLQKGLPTEPNLLLPRPRPWATALLTLVALIGLLGGIGLIRMYHRVPSPLQQEASSLPSPAVEKIEQKGQPSAVMEQYTPAVAPTSTGETGTPKLTSKGGTVKRATSGKRVVLSGKRGQGVQASQRMKATPPKRHPIRSQSAPSAKSGSTALPEGAIEVYDESGQLVKRDQIRGAR